MIITCPDCTARFVVKAEAIGAKGRKVKCAKCKGNWFQEPDKEALEQAAQANPQEEPKETEPIPEGSNVPAVKASRGSLIAKVAFAAMLALFLFSLSIVGANSVLPGMSGYYALFGIYDSTDIALYDVKVEKIASSDSGRYEDLEIMGKIVNESDTQKYLPDLRLVIYGDEGQHLKTVTLDSEGTLIEAGEGIDFENTIPRIPKKSANIVMDIGNSLDLAFR